MEKKQITTIAAIAMGLFYCSIYINYKELNYLGAPFFYISYDSFMDFFNTNWHSQRIEKAFTEWYSIYSPLNLYFANLMVSKNCVGLESSLALRLCDLDRYFIIFSAAYVIFILLLILIQLREKKLSYLIFVMPLSFPILYALERGNYIILAAIFATLGLLIKNEAIKNILYAIQSNIKFYIILPFVLILDNRYEIFKNMIIFFIVLIIGAIVYQDENWYLYFRNLFIFNGNVDYIQKYWMPTELGVYKIYPDNSFLKLLIHVISILIKFYVLIKIYLIYFSINKINYDKDLLYCIFFLGISQLFNIGYYSYLILFPYFIKLDINNRISKYAFCTICYILIPFFSFEIYQMQPEQQISFIGKNIIIFKQTFITINSFLIPIAGFILFCSFSNQLNVEKYESRN